MGKEKPKIVWIGNRKWTPVLKFCLENLANLVDVPVVFTEPGNEDSFENLGYRKEDIYTSHLNNHSEEFLREVKKRSLDFGVILGCSYLIKPPVLGYIPLFGTHPTKLPIGRGHAPLNWNIKEGLTESAATMMWLNKGEDTGAIAYQEPYTIGEKENVTELLGKVNGVYCGIMSRLVRDFSRGTIPRISQNSLDVEPTRRRRLSPEDGTITPEMDIATADRIYRATTEPFPGARLEYDGHRIILRDAEIVPYSETLEKNLKEKKDAPAYVVSGNKLIIIYRRELERK